MHGSQFSHTIKQASGSDRTDVSESGYNQLRGPSARTGTTENECTMNQEDNKRTNAARVRIRARMENEGVREDRRTKTRVRVDEQGHHTTTKGTSSSKISYNSGSGIRSTGHQ